MLNKLQEKIAFMRQRGETLAQEHFLQNKVSEDIQKQRYDICSACEFLLMPSNRCQKCGCFMGVKTWMPNQKCPINKWGKVIDNEPK